MSDLIPKPRAATRLGFMLVGLGQVRVRAVAGLVTAAASAAVPAGIAQAGPNPVASCVAHASAFFGQGDVRDDAAHRIKDVFGIPPGAEVSRFAHVRLGSAPACIEEGQP